VQTILAKTYKVFENSALFRMRYGKKLALCLLDEGHATKPFISHKLWRDVLGRAVKEHRTGCDSSSLAALDQEFLNILTSDYELISGYCKQTEEGFLGSLDDLAAQAQLKGITSDGPVARMAIELQKTLINSEYPLLAASAGATLRAVWSELAALVSDLCNQFNGAAWKWQQHLNYLDVNIAGFRKTIKQRGKQIDFKFPGFEEYQSLSSSAIHIQEKFLVLHSQLDPCLKLFAPGAELYLSKVGSETAAAARASETDLVQLLLSLMPRE